MNQALKTPSKPNNLDFPTIDFDIDLDIDLDIDDIDGDPSLFAELEAELETEIEIVRKIPFAFICKKFLGFAY